MARVVFFSQLSFLNTWHGVFTGLPGTGDILYLWFRSQLGCLSQPFCYLYLGFQAFNLKECVLLSTELIKSY